MTIRKIFEPGMKVRVWVNTATVRQSLWESWHQGPNIRKVAMNRRSVNVATVSTYKEYNNHYGSILEATVQCRCPLVDSIFCWKMFFSWHSQKLVRRYMKTCCGTLCHSMRFKLHKIYFKHKEFWINLCSFCKIKYAV